MKTSWEALNCMKIMCFLQKIMITQLTDAIWLVKKHDTKVQVTYKYIGLSDKGNQFLNKFTSSKYKEFIDEWKSLLDTYFTTKC